MQCSGANRSVETTAAASSDFQYLVNTVRAAAKHNYVVSRRFDAHGEVGLKTLARKWQWLKPHLEDLPLHKTNQQEPASRRRFRALPAARTSLQPWLGCLVSKCVRCVA